MQNSNLIVAAGAILWRHKIGKTTTSEQKPAIEVAIVHRPRYNDWSWPKGKVKTGETLPAAAVREVAEETGCEITLTLPLPSSKYRVGQSQKRVFYWLAQPAHPAHLQGRTAWKRASKQEIDRVRWVTLEQAKRLLTREIDRELAQKAARLLQDPGCYSPYGVVVVRHAKAMKRQKWAAQAALGGIGLGRAALGASLGSAELEGCALGEAGVSDQLRPLTRSGMEQAQRLVGTLAGFGVGQVFSSSSLRCLQTMQNFTTAASVELKQVQAFSEESFQGHREKTLAVWSTILDTYFGEELCKNTPENQPYENTYARNAIAICSHRPVLPTLIQELLKNQGTQADPQEATKIQSEAPTQPLRPLEVGECLIAHFNPTGALLSTQIVKS